MKSISFKKEVVTVESLDDNSFVGIVWSGDKSIVIKTREGFTSLSNTGINISSYYSTKTLNAYVLKAKEDCCFKEALLFDSYKEMLEWFCL